MTQTTELDKSYDPVTVEQRIYRKWVENKHFHAEPDPGKEPFTIVIPPPNITGSLHMGHALDNTIQDVIIRFQRMLGKAACWVPGTDHAGIATQRVVEKELLKEGKTRHDIGREQLLERVWTWREQYGNTIVEQLKRLGVSCDWDRLAFTMDATRSRAVREAFVRLYQKGDIYRGKRLINWCPHCLTALSDLEVEHEDGKGELYYLSYPLASGAGSPEGITIATTRPETIQADVAVAVNPEDARYKHLIGQECTIPVFGRRIPIIADNAVLSDFGTGALKITPAHDPTDFEIGERHGLAQLVGLDETGKVTELGQHYQGQDRFKVRKAIVKELEEKGFLVKTESHDNKVGTCYRCHTVVEPYLSEQWFMKMSRLAQPGIEAVKNGDIRFVPERYTKSYLNWMENLRDWCISRQIWWGHRIPVWTCQKCSHQQAHLADPDGCPKCGDKNYVQEDDVLDTWFSSGLWPFSVFGWPEKTRDLQYFYPTNVLVTARDIIYLWVARMIIFGYELMGQKPYSDVLIHATILTHDGKRMSKSLGTGIDPLELIEKFGADGTRFALMIQATHSQDIRHNEERYEMGRNFCNKIWNATRLSLRLFPAGLTFSDKPQPTSRVDGWILARTDDLVERTREAYANYNFDEASKAVYEFFWNELCDWYLELIKPVFYHRQDPKEQAAVAQVLLYALDRWMRVAHPIMPFITEELWQHLPGDRKALILSEFPKSQNYPRRPVEEMDFLQDVVRGIRNLRAEMGLQPKQKAEVVLQSEDNRALLESAVEMLGTLAQAEPVRLDGQRPAKALSQRIGQTEVFLPFPADFNPEAEVRRLQAELAEVTGHLERIAKKLENPAFVEKAKPEVVARERERLQEHQERARRVQERLALFGDGV